MYRVGIIKPLTADNFGQMFFPLKLTWASAVGGGGTWIFIHGTDRL